LKYAEKNLNGGMKHQEEQERRERKISKIDYSKTEMTSYYAEILIS
jgi:hypothetical protein